jgi:hypothetical protein
MDQETTNNGLGYYRIKTEWTKETSTGALAKVKTEELVLATSYTEAEKVAYGIIEDQSRTQFGSANLEIIKTKISNVLFNRILAQDPKPICGLICNFFEESEESGFGFYTVKVVYFETDEKSGKTKSSNDMFFVPATSNANAIVRVEHRLADSALDFVIRDTKFDKAEAIYWPESVHQDKMKELDLA